MKILFITQYFYPENFRGNDIAFELAKENDVHVLCGTPNYPQGKFYSGYGWFRRNNEVINGVKVTRLPIIPRGNNVLSLFLNYYSFMIVSWVYILFHAIFHKYDCVLIQQLSPIMMSVPAILYKKLRHVPLYTWVLDLWPESLTVGGGINNPYILKYFASYAAREYKWSDKILVSSNSFKQAILKYGPYDDKLIYFPQWAEDSFVNENSDESLPFIPEGFKIMFAGNVGEAQDFENIMAAALESKNRKDIKWLIVGDGRKLNWVKDFVEQNDLADTVYLYGHYPIQKMPAFFKKADIMLVSLKKSEILSLTAPAKIQAYMAASKPIIAMMDGEGADLVNKAQCGYTAPAGDYTKLVELVNLYANLPMDELKDCGENGYQFYKKYFDKYTCLMHLKSILNSI